MLTNLQFISGEEHIDAIKVRITLQGRLPHCQGSRKSRAGCIFLSSVGLKLDAQYLGSKKPNMESWV